MIKLAAAGLLTGCNPLRQMTSTPADDQARLVTQLPAPSATIAPSSTIAEADTPTRAPTATATTAATVAVPTATARIAAPTKSATPTLAPSRTSTPTPTLAATSTPTATPTSTPTEAPSQAAGILSSKVVVVRHGGAWQRGVLAADVLELMLDRSVTQLTGVADADAAWASLFAPHEKVAIKVNALMPTAETSAQLVMAVTDRLQAAGVPGEQIVIFDRSTRELEYAGYRVNRDGPGVRCYGTDGAYSPGWHISGTEIMLSEILLDCDALINMPVLKQHAYTGISLAIKNHYGTFDKPASFHTGIDSAMAQLNGLPPIRERTRLLIGDMLKVVLGDNWLQKVPGDTLTMSLDPVAHDAVGLQQFVRVLDAAGRDTAAFTRRAGSWLATCAELGLGNADVEKIDLSEVDLPLPG